MNDMTTIAKPAKRARKAPVSDAAPAPAPIARLVPSVPQLFPLSSLRRAPEK